MKSLIAVVALSALSALSAHGQSSYSTIFTTYTSVCYDTYDVSASATCQSNESGEYEIILTAARTPIIGPYGQDFCYYLPPLATIKTPCLNCVSQALTEVCGASTITIGWDTTEGDAYGASCFLDTDTETGCPAYDASCFGTFAVSEGDSCQANESGASTVTITALSTNTDASCNGQSLTYYTETPCLNCVSQARTEVCGASTITIGWDTTEGDAYGASCFLDTDTETGCVIEGTTTETVTETMTFSDIFVTTSVTDKYVMDDVSDDTAEPVVDSYDSLRLISNGNSFSYGCALLGYLIAFF